MKHKKAFIKEINEKLEIGLKFGEGKKFIKTLAEKYNMAESTATVYFYEVKKEFESKKPSVSLEKEEPIYKVDGEIEFTVKGILGYGVVGETKEGIKTLVHISRVKNEFISNLERYFKLGDKVKGKIHSISPENEISVTTIGYWLPDYNKKTEHPELKQVEEFLKPIIGELSEEARNEFQKVIEEKGIFQLSLTLGKHAPTFKADLGLLLLNELKKHWNDEL